MDISQLQERLDAIDHALSVENLRPRERFMLFATRSRLVGHLETARKQQALEVLKRRAWREMERRTPGPFMGERLIGGPRNIPGAEGAGVFIQPQVVPGGRIRGFVPNESYRDPVNIDPGRLKMMREKDRRRLHRI